MSRLVLVHQGDAEQGMRSLKKLLQVEGVSPGKKRFFKTKSQIRYESKSTRKSNSKVDSKRFCNGFAKIEKQ